MKVNRKKLEIELARRCMPISELRTMGLSPHTLRCIQNGVNAKPVTVGKIAKALGVDPIDIIED